MMLLSSGGSIKDFSGEAGTIEHSCAREIACGHSCDCLSSRGSRGSRSSNIKEVSQACHTHVHRNGMGRRGGHDLRSRI